MNLRRTTFVAIVLSSGILTACGTSPPPADEFANEMIDTMRDIDEDERACMHRKADSFTIPFNSNFTSLGDVAEAAADGNDEAEAVLKQFEDALATCVEAG